MYGINDYGSSSKIHHLIYRIGFIVSLVHALGKTGAMCDILYAGHMWCICALRENKDSCHHTVYMNIRTSNAAMPQVIKEALKIQPAHGDISLQATISELRKWEAGALAKLHELSKRQPVQHRMQPSTSTTLPAAKCGPIIWTATTRLVVACPRTCFIFCVQAPLNHNRLFSIQELGQAHSMTKSSEVQEQAERTCRQPTA